MKSQISTNSLRRLREALPKGGVNTLSERLNLSQGFVSNVLNGKADNLTVITAAMELVKEIKEHAKAIEKEIHEITAL